MKIFMCKLITSVYSVVHMMSKIQLVPWFELRGEFAFCVCISCFLCAGDVRFSFRNTTYQNNSLVTLEDIGEDDNALFCLTNLTTCCKPGGIGNWFLPNETKVASTSAWWDFHRTRGQMVVRLNRKRGGEEGIYHCEIPDSANVTQSIYIGVYSASTGEWHCLYTLVLFNCAPYSRVRCD